MNSREKIVLVDIDDNVTGYDTKENVHKKGILHRAFSVFIVNNDKMLLQRRSVNKYHSGGLWTNACCSHQREGEELNEAVHRRLKEELGFDCKLNECFDFVYRTQFKDDLFEYELDHVFIGEYSGPVLLNKDEASEIKWVSFEKIKTEMLTNPEAFTSWFIICAPQVIKDIL